MILGPDYGGNLRKGPGIARLRFDDIDFVVGNYWEEWAQVHSPRGRRWCRKQLTAVGSMVPCPPATGRGSSAGSRTKSAGQRIGPGCVSLGPLAVTMA